MRKLVLTILVLCFSFIAYCQTGNKHLEVSGGIFLNQTYQGRIGLEFSKKYHNSLAIYADLFRYKYEEDKIYLSEFLLGPTYKMIVSRSKNLFFKIPVGFSIGSDTENFIGTVQGGFELGAVMHRNLTFTLTQFNQVAFNSYKQWRVGINAGIKIPLN